MWLILNIKYILPILNKMYSNIPHGRVFAQCSKCERLFPVNLDGKSDRFNCRLHKIKNGKCKDCGSITPFKSKDFDHNCYHTTKKTCPCLIL